MLEIY